jgi:hypothetical protein
MSVINASVPSFKKALFHSESTRILYDYIERVEDFISTEIQENAQYIKEVEEKLTAGEIPTPNDPYQMPDQIRWSYDQFQDIEEIKVILWHSTIVSIYGFLESMLIKHCREKKGDKGVKKFLDEKSQDSIIKKALKCIGYQFEMNSAWERIECLGRLRNCIVHNAAYLKPTDRLKLQEFIVDNEPHLSVSDSEFIIVDKTFCHSQMHVVEKFLIDVILSPA